MSEHTASQRAAILETLKKGRSITPQDALRQFGCFRLAARIYDLREAGYDIATLWEDDGHKRWARYHLLKSAQH